MGQKKGVKKVKTSTKLRTELTVQPVEENTVEKKIPKYLIEPSRQRERDIIIHDYYMHSVDGKRELQHGVTLRFIYGHHYGIIGQNGIGKTTQLNQIASYNIQTFPDDIRVVYQRQEEWNKEQQDISVLDYVMNSDEEMNYLRNEVETLEKKMENDNDDSELNTIIEKIDILYQRISEIEENSSETHALNILHGQQFTDDMIKQSINMLSGGWKTRVRLACVLFIKPDQLLLDEPTNHLDFPAIDWLQNFLKEYEPTIIVVSHDRNFLDTIITDCIDFCNKQQLYYRGDYTNYIKVRSENIIHHNNMYEKIEKKRRMLTKFILEARQKAKEDPNLAELAKTRQRILDTLPKLQPIKPLQSISFSFPDPGTLDHSIIECYNMSFKYENTTKLLLDNINVNIRLSSCIGIMGANGVGKTTLIKILLKNIEPIDGVIKLNTQARCKIFTQYHLEMLDDKLSPIDFLQKQFPQAKTSSLLDFLGHFGFSQKLATQPIHVLSGGEKSRVSFAYLTYQKPHLIIMDEPTNHLDIETIESLIIALQNFKGAIVIISHDKYFLSKIAKEFWAINSIGKLQVFYDLNEAKEFSYKQVIKYDDTNLRRKVPLKVNTSSLSLSTKVDDNIDNDEQIESMLYKLEKNTLYDDKDSISTMKFFNENNTTYNKYDPSILQQDKNEDRDDHQVLVSLVDTEEKVSMNDKKKKKGKKNVVIDDKDEDEEILAALAALEVQASPDDKKKKKGKKNVVIDDKDEDEEILAALAALEAQASPDDKKKKKGKKNVVIDDQDEDEEMLAALAALEDQASPDGKKKKKGKKNVVIYDQDEDEEILAALAALEMQGEEDIVIDKKKNKNHKKMR